MCCQTLDAMEARETTTGKFEDKLINTDTHPGITAILLLAIRGEPILAAKELRPGDDNLFTDISE